MNARCIVALAAGCIVGLVAALATGTAVASYFFPGGPTPAGIGFVLAFGVLGTVGGILVNWVQFCGSN